MKKFSMVGAAIFVILALFLTGCSVDKVVRLAIIFDSPIADDAFSTACLRGMEKAHKEWGTPLIIYESLNESQSADLQKTLAKSKNYNIIICVGSSNTLPLQALSVKYPEQKFILVDGDIADKENICSLQLQDNESSFLAGALAAMVSQTGKIGFIGGMDIPAIQRFLAGYQAGAAYINPNCEVLTDYSGTWLNDGKTRELALAQYARGADVIFSPSGAGSMGMISAAQATGKLAIGVDADQSAAAPQNVVASTLKNVDTALYDTIKLALNRDFKGGIRTSGLKEGGVGFITNDALPVITQQVKETIADIKAKIIAGAIVVPDGAVN